MEIEEAEAGHLEQVAGDDLAVVREHAEIRLEHSDLVDDLGLTDAHRLQERDPHRPGAQRDGRGQHRLPPPGRAVRRGDDPDELDAGVARERVEGRDGERAGAEEDRSHPVGRPPGGRAGGHARAGVFTRDDSEASSSASTSSSLAGVTEMSSSIESR